MTSLIFPPSHIVIFNCLFHSPSSCRLVNNCGRYEDGCSNYRFGRIRASLSLFIPLVASIYVHKRACVQQSTSAVCAILYICPAACGSWQQQQQQLLLVVFPRLVYPTSLSSGSRRLLFLLHCSNSLSKHPCGLINTSSSSASAPAACQYLAAASCSEYGWDQCCAARLKYSTHPPTHSTSSHSMAASPRQVQAHDIVAI